MLYSSGWKVKFLFCALMTKNCMIKRQKLPWFGRWMGEGSWWPGNME